MPITLLGHGHAGESSGVSRGVTTTESQLAELGSQRLPSAEVKTEFGGVEFALAEKSEGERGLLALSDRFETHADQAVRLGRAETRSGGQRDDVLVGGLSARDGQAVEIVVSFDLTGAVGDRGGVTLGLTILVWIETLAVAIENDSTTT